MSDILVDSPKRYGFLSYSSTDKEFAARLASDLKKYHFPMFFAQWEIKVGDSIVEKIDSALSEMTDLIIILSNNSINSDWVKKELSSGLMKKLDGHSVSILPVLKEKCSVPSIILDLKSANFTNSYEDGLLDLVEGLKLTIKKGGIPINVKAYVRALLFHEDSIRIIQEAGKKTKLLWLEAREEDGSIEPRVVEPYSFRARGKGGTLLFFAYDIAKKAIRGFRVDRIQSVTELEEDFKPRWPVEFE
ncbi:TIR domain-containing protein [Nitrosopumilus sp.]|uniref:TIR domain-containing protein n=1 Tax=Nitrosopumilus sp. TaxID=2024843 RepID=UPI00260E7024|nr:TIR domain-containing protein [Nitrosopumilus sp.]